MKTVSKSKTRIILSIIGLLFSVYTYSQIPVYNSYPSASATVYLDFDGHYLEGSSWNYSGPLSLGPANMTNDQITEVFKRVAGITGLSISISQPIQQSIGRHRLRKECV